MSDVRLELFDDRHLAGLAEMLPDRDVLRWTRVPDPVPDGFERQWLARYERAREDGTAEAFAVVDGAGAFLGIAVAPEIEPEARQAELGYVIARQARGRGVASRALALLTAWAFEELALARVALLISTDNDASKAVAARNGYRFEGVLRSLWFKQDLRADTEIWSLLPGDRAVSAGPA